LFFSRCTLENGEYKEINGTQTIKPDEVISSKIVQQWKGKSVADYANSDLDFKQTMDIIDDVWMAREKGENVILETEQIYGGWYQNYLRNIE
jgi:hypothetical protein